jgi:hypothetical protein
MHAMAQLYAREGGARADDGAKGTVLRGARTRMSPRSTSAVPAFVVAFGAAKGLT